MIYLNLFLEFMKIGAFTFSGGYAMIPLIEKEIVNKYQWLTMKQFTDLIAIAEMTPGPMAVNSATLVGYKVAKFWGAVVSTLGVVLPSFLIIWAIASVFSQFQNNPTVQAAFKGLRPAVLGLIIVAAISISKTSILSEYKSILIVIGTVLALTIFKIHPILVLIISAITGIVFLR